MKLTATGLICGVMIVVIGVGDYFAITDNTELLDEAYTHGHEDGRAWCGKDKPIHPSYDDEELQEKYWQGFALGERAAGCTYNDALADPECFTDECVEAWGEDDGYYMDEEEEVLL